MDTVLGPATYNSLKMLSLQHYNLKTAFQKNKKIEELSVGYQDVYSFPWWKTGWKSSRNVASLLKHLENALGV
jgi:hypothetical protein